MKTYKLQISTNLREELGALFVDGNNTAEMQNGVQLIKQVIQLAREGNRVMLDCHEDGELVLCQYDMALGLATKLDKRPKQPTA